MDAAERGSRIGSERVTLHALPLLGAEEARLLLASSDGRANVGGRDSLLARRDIEARHLSSPGGPPRRAVRRATCPYTTGGTMKTKSKIKAGAFKLGLTNG
ncbi:hypothetical protein [Nannocystis pusilla]|uniref:hypothetical protein n=1 Tax=Nannocystis pusilla TaxID=889268 RepID=UPI003B7BEF02